MDYISNEKTLYRILQGRLRYKSGDLVLYIYEPSRDVLEGSYDIYEEAYQKAYFEGVYVKEELLEILISNDLWTPLDDREADTLDKQIEELKIRAFKSFFKTKELMTIKRNIRHLERKMLTCRSKKHCLDYVSCDGVAAFARSVWIISQTTKHIDNTLYDWSNLTISSVMSYYDSHPVHPSDFRAIARNDPWRSMWHSGKKQANVLGKPACEFTRDQLSLCSYSSMYDNVYESSESPHEKVIEDDDCLDGWFIVQRREVEKNKTQKDVNNLISNPKIANSQEVFVMTPDQESANKLYELNDPVSRNVVRSRQAQLDEIDYQDGTVDFKKLHDIQQDISMARTQSYIDKVKRG